MLVMFVCFLGLGWTDRILVRFNLFNIDVFFSFIRYFICLFIKYIVFILYVFVGWIGEILCLVGDSVGGNLMIFTVMRVVFFGI